MLLQKYNYMITTNDNKYELNKWYTTGEPAWNKSTIWQRFLNWLNK